MRLNRNVKTAAVATAVLATTLLLSSCDDDGTDSKETERKLAAYEKIVKNQPLQNPEYSTTRSTINKWIQTWGSSSSKNKLSYVYLQNGEGDYGYFILKGLPVSYCAMGTPPAAVDSSSNGKVLKPLPGMDGTYSSGAGACNTYYGFDATTGAYLEFTVGMNQSFFLFDKPSTLPEYASAKQMGPTSVKDAKK